MIQFNTTSQLGTNNSLDASIANLESQTGTDSFDSALSAAINTTLEKFGIDPSTVNISIGSSATPSGSPMATAPTSTATPATTTSSAPTSPATANDSSTDSTQSFDDAYWASQPPAVQALRGMQDEDQRMQLATQLQQQGYTIDVPVMVWHWDPSVTTSLRQSFGYTWVPAMGQAPIPMAPGLSGFGPAYDPNNPPPGSIIVPPIAT